MNKDLKKIIKDYLPINANSLLKRNIKKIDPVQVAESDFYQTNYSVCSYPQKPISKIL